MYKLKQILFLTLIIITFFNNAFSKERPYYIEQLKATDLQTKSKALAQIIAEKEVIYFPILEAINTKKIFLYQNRLVTLGKKHNENNTTAYELIYLYPKKKAVVNNSSKVVEKLTNLKALKFSRKDRLSIIPILPFINLTSNDSDIRKLAYSQFQNKIDIKNIPILEEASKLETNKELKRYAKETILAVQLFETNKSSKQIELIKQLSRNKGDNTAFLLQKFLDEKPIENQVKIQVKKEISILKSRASRIDWLQNLFSGLSLGSILILISLGLAIIYGLAGVINMAHGEFMMIGAYTTFVVQELFKIMLGPQIGDLFFWVSIPIAFIVSGFFGLIIERLIIRKLYGNPLQSLLATWGISLVFIQLARSVFGDLTSVQAPTLLSGGWHIAPQLVLPYNRIFIILFTIIMVILTFLFLYKSKYGLRIRAVTQNREISACLGISTKRIDSITFFIGSGIAGIAGACMTLIGNIVPDMGQTYIVDSFLVVVTGGVGNLMGTIIAGLGIGQLTKLLEPVFHAVYGKVIILAIIIFFLQFKPKGLFPPKGRIANE